MRRRLLTVALAVVLSVASLESVSAEPGNSLDGGGTATDGDTATVWSGGGNSLAFNKLGKSGPTHQTRLHGGGKTASRAQQIARYKSAIASYHKATQQYELRAANCLRLPDAGGLCRALRRPSPPADLTDVRLLKGGTGTQPPQLTPQQVAEIAVAQLTVPTVKAGIGPPPEINRWKMAVVGYPLWLYPDSPTHIGPVAHTVGNQTVSLDATLASITYKMGDGNTTTCPGVGTRWTSTITPGAESPTCGYRYQKPSLPKGTYTVTAIATWAVTWTINGHTGVINIYTTSNRQLPVGELQAVIR